MIKHINGVRSWRIYTAKLDRKIANKKMKRRLSLLFPLFFFAVSLQAKNPFSANYIFSDVSILKNGWQVYFDTLFTSLDAIPDTIRLPEPKSVTLPANWNKDYSNFRGKKTEYGCATYRLVLNSLTPDEKYAVFIKESPTSSCAVFADGVCIASSGAVSSKKRGFFPSTIPIYAEFTANQSGSAELVIQVSNWIYRKGGIRTPVYFGKRDSVYRSYSTNTGLIFFVSGLLLFLCIINFALFAFNPKKLSSLYFSLFLVFLILRICTADIDILSFIFKNLPYSAAIKLEYSALWVVPPLFIFFLYSLFHCTFYHRLKYVYAVLQGVVLIVGTVLPIELSNRLVPLYQITCFIGLVYIMILLIRACIKKEKQIYIHLVSVLLVGGTTIYETLYSVTYDELLIDPLPFVLLALAVIQFLALASRESRLFSRQVALIHNLKKLNDAYIRFVPQKFLDLLNKKNITDVHLGDYVECEMGILFMQIYIGDGSFEVTPEEQYDVFSSFTMIASPLIAERGGFISKFVKRGIMALFSGGTQKIIECCFELQQKIGALNAVRKEVGKPPIGIASGIHYGKMILGTIGELSRMDDTVISDTVNTAARIESISESLHYSILVSLDAVEKSNLAENENFALIPLGNIHVKGKRKPVFLFVCMPLESLKKESTVEKNIPELDFSVWAKGSIQ